MHYIFSGPAITGACNDFFGLQNLISEDRFFSESQKAVSKINSISIYFFIL